MTDTEFDPLDLNEDGEVSPMEELIGLAGELQTLQAEDFNLWRGQRLARLMDLIENGIEGEDFVYHPDPETEAPEDFDEQGFSLGLSNGCVAHKTIIETAQRWAESNDRLLEYAASFMLRNRYMLPIPRLEGDEAWQERYRLTQSVKTTQRFTFGRSGYINKPVFETLTVDEAGHSLGTGVIDDHYCPFAGGNQADILNIFLEDMNSGAFRHRFLTFAANALAEMDRGNLDKWEGYRPVPNALQWNRRAELELARSNPNY